MPTHRLRAQDTLQPVDAKGTLPVVAVVHSADPVSLFDLVKAADGCCQLVSILDGDPSAGRILRHLGPVVDITGLSDDDAGEKVRALAPDGIATFRNRALRRTAALADRLRLPFHSPDVAATLLDKYSQRQALERAGLDGPRFRLVEPGDSAAGSIVGDLRFPVVVKPSAGLGSRETFLARSIEEVTDALASAWSAGAGAMVVEEYLHDSEEVMAADYASFVSVESVIGGGTLRHLALIGKFPPAPPFRETGHFTPSQLSPAAVETVLDTVGAAIGGLGVTVGALHTEVKITPDGPRIIEVNGRTGGAVPDVLLAAGGCSLMQAAMRVALGETPSDEGLSPCDRVGFRINVQPPTSAHRVRSVEGVEQVRQLPGIQSVTVLRNEGDAVNWRLGTDQLVAALIGAVDSLDALGAIRRQVSEGLSIAYE